VNDDEEHFIVFGPFRARPLQGQQLINGQVRPIGDGAILHLASLCDFPRVFLRVLFEKKNFVCFVRTKKEGKESARDDSFPIHA
jgi:hypothetical protein